MAHLRDVVTRMQALGEEPEDDVLGELPPDRSLAVHPDAKLPLSR